VFVKTELSNPIYTETQSPLVVSRNMVDIHKNIRKSCSPKNIKIDFQTWRGDACDAQVEGEAHLRCRKLKR